MKRSLAAVLLSTSLSLAVHSQTPPATEPPAAPRPAPIVSPDIQADRTVTFRLKAPTAKAVLVRGQWDKTPLPLQRSEDGVWSGTARAVAPGVWEYSFDVDSLSIPDPGNPAIKASREPRTSILHLAASPPAAWDFQDVPHGAVHHHTYLSKALGRPRELSVYTPPGYSAANPTKYPLLVLQHGSGDNQLTWVAHGKAHWILDNLIATGNTRPMIVLMIDGHPLGRTSPQDLAQRAAAFEAFRRELFEDALPLVEEQYSVATEPSQRAIAGLSMGGAQALSIGLGNLDRFTWIGAFSAGPVDEKMTAPIFADTPATNARLRLLWIACGKDDKALQRNEELASKLKTSGIQHEWHPTQGAHTWPVWRSYLNDFLPRLFQPAGK